MVHVEAGDALHCETDKFLQSAESSRRPDGDERYVTVKPANVEHSVYEEVADGKTLSYCYSRLHVF